VICLNDDKYIEMLEKIKNLIPQESEQEERFNPVEPRVSFEKRRSIIGNFREVAQSLQREPKFMASFFGKEIAAPAIYNDPRLIIQTKVNPRSLKEVWRKFLRKYVICPACGGPDSKLTKMKRILTIKCEVCGVNTPVEAI